MNAPLRDVRDADGVLTGLELLERFRDVRRTLGIGSLLKAQEGEQAGLHPGDHLLVIHRLKAIRR